MEKSMSFHWRSGTNRKAVNVVEEMYHCCFQNLYWFRRHSPMSRGAQNQNISNERIPMERYGGTTQQTYKIRRTLQQLLDPNIPAEKMQEGIRQQPFHPIRYLHHLFPSSYLSCLLFGTDSSHFTGCRLKNGQSGTHIYPREWWTSELCAALTCEYKIKEYANCLQLRK